LLNCVSMENIDHENMLEKVSKKVGALLWEGASGWNGYGTEQYDFNGPTN
jgi:hypothetical protein